MKFIDNKHEEFWNNKYKRNGANGKRQIDIIKQ